MDKVRSRLRYALLALLGAIMVGSVGYWLLRRPAPTVVLVQRAQRTAQPTTAVEEWVCCYVTGAVAAAGVYTLPYGSRVHDAIRAAGGAIADADVAALNMAALVHDQDHIIVPRAGIAPAADTPDNADASRGQMLLLVDINSAGSEALQTLPGIGPVLAARIVQYRSEFGPFGSAEDLTQVSGIGEKKLADLLPFIIAGP
jgi:competence protein ComEA